MKRWFYLSAILSALLYAESVDEALEGFDDAPQVTQETKSKEAKSETDAALAGFDDESASENASGDDLQAGFDDANASATEQGDTPFLSIEGLTGALTQTWAYSYRGKGKDHGLSMLKHSLFLDYEHGFENGWKFKINAKAYYDALYDLRDQPYTAEEKAQFRSEFRLYDAYLEGSLTEHLDFRLGNQVVVWGRSDTIRITDILNPLDNRRPGMVDIEDLRLPVPMLKLDWYIDTWRITPIAILSGHFTLNPPYGSPLYPLPIKAPDDENYHDLSFALSIGRDFDAGDLNLYAARVRQDQGVLKLPPTLPLRLKHEKTTMLGAAANFLSGSWLFKGEFAHFSDIYYNALGGASRPRDDALVGVEYNGIADTMISYDFSVRHIENYAPQLTQEFGVFGQNSYQHAFRITSDFMNATLHANYLISLFGASGKEGGFQRLWATYDINDNLKATAGVVDYIGGSRFFDRIKDADMLFMELKYSF